MLNEVVCHCGAVVLHLSEKPVDIFECNCATCRKLGVLWAYYHCDDVVIEKGAGSTDIYVCNNKALEFHRCAHCGCTIYWKAIDPTFREKMGVNARLIDGLTRQNTALNHIDHGEIGWFWSRDPGA